MFRVYLKRLLRKLLRRSFRATKPNRPNNSSLSLGYHHHLHRVAIQLVAFLYFKLHKLLLCNFEFLMTVGCDMMIIIIIIMIKQILNL